MKKKIIFLLMLCVSGTACAADASFLTGPTSPQSYHSVAETSVASVTQPAATPVISTSDANNGAALISSNINASTQVSQTQLSQWQKKIDQHLQNLEANNQASDQNILVLQQQMMQLTAAPKNTTFSGMTYLKRYKNIIIYTSIGVALILFGLGILVGRLFGTRKTTIVQNALHPQIKTVGDVLADDRKNEYDFMGTREAIPAKLDLARSYIAMGDVEQAKNALKIVLDKGNEALRFEAESLLNKLNTGNAQPETQ